MGMREWVVGVPHRNVKRMRKVKRVESGENHSFYSCQFTYYNYVPIINI